MFTYVYNLIGPMMGLNPMQTRMAEISSGGPIPISLKLFIACRVLKGAKLQDLSQFTAAYKQIWGSIFIPVMKCLDAPQYNTENEGEAAKKDSLSTYLKSMDDEDFQLYFNKVNEERNRRQKCKDALLLTQWDCLPLFHQPPMERRYSLFGDSYRIRSDSTSLDGSHHLSPFPSHCTT